MKIAVISDVHANFVALRKVSDHIESWRADYVIVAGDLINRGPRPSECLDFILEKQETKGWMLLRGNHEDYVLNWAQPNSSHLAHAKDVHQASRWTYDQIQDRISAVKSMPFQQSLWDPRNREVRFVHASMEGKREGIYPESSNSSIAKKLHLVGDSSDPVMYCVGHTHRPLIRRLSDHTTVVNAGSAGLPFDMDTRLSYAQLVWENGIWNAEIVRLEYNIQQAERDFYLTGYLVDGGPLVELVLTELREARSQLYYWAINYQEKVMDGELSMRESVDLFNSSSPP